MSRPHLEADLIAAFAALFLLPLAAQDAVELRPSVSRFKALILVRDEGFGSLTTGHLLNNYTSWLCPGTVICVVARNDGKGEYRVSHIRFRMAAPDDAWIERREPKP